MTADILSDLIVPPVQLATLGYLGVTTGWIYISNDLTFQLNDLIKDGIAKYVATCWETGRSGRQYLIAFIIFKSVHSENALKTRYGFSAGVLLAKHSKKVTPCLVVRWMQGNYYTSGFLKPRNETFQEVRCPNYKMLGREKDKAFLSALWEGS